jgi:riboflavin kinase / FMN adenylyltransferase
VQPEQAMPKDGIYATIVRREGWQMNSVTNIGVRPTFDGLKRLIETYIWDFSGDLYGKKLRIDLVARLRDEMRFNSVEELKTQMGKDVEKAKQIFKEIPRTKYEKL